MQTETDGRYGGEQTAASTPDLSWTLSRLGKGKKIKIFPKLKQKILKADRYKQNKCNPLLNSDPYQKEHVSSTVRTTFPVIINL